MRTTVTQRRVRGSWARAVALSVTTVVAAAALAGCSSSSDSSAPVGNSPADFDKALHTKTTLTVWAWDPGYKAVAEAFEKKYPDITVNLQNVGTATDQSVKLQNAIKAGSGAPDVAQLNYDSISQFAVSKGLFDLRGVGFASLQPLFTESAWTDVKLGDGIYALPLGIGPMALFYNKKYFDAAGITKPPATWAEYLDAARKIHAHNPSQYITSDAGDDAYITTLIQQAGGHPFRTDGTKVTVNLTDAGSKKAADMWNPLIQEGLLAPIAPWSDQWYKGLADGTIASLTYGSWMAGNLVSGVPAGKGDWRVAPMPAYTAGDTAIAEHGGGGAAVIAQSMHKTLAAAFLKFLTAGDGQKIELDSVGGVPAAIANLNDPAWVNAENEESEYFGGQKINKFFAEAAKNIVPGWQWTPFQVYANTIFNDTVGKSYSSKTDLNQGLKAWQTALTTYGNQQGFTVTND
ncbi:MAG: sugar ABC transporter substrate-binding protein [Gordonia sp. (in: high G+C Gram-positive bacteria)]